MRYPFYNALTHVKTFFGITLTDDDFENIAMHAWDHIDSKEYLTYRYCTTVKNKQIDLPCNADIIEAVLIAGEGYRNKDNVISGDNSNSDTEEYVETSKRNGNVLYESGTFVPYERAGNTLYFKQDNFSVTILYRGVVVDELGLPSLTFKEVDAIAKYCAYVDTQKRGMVTGNQAFVQMSQLLKQQWMFACDDARTPEYLNQNDMDQIMDVMSSWDRKRFGMSFKPIR